MAKIALTEDQEQILLMERAKYNPITREYLYSYPIEGFRHPLTAIRLKKKGAKAGIPDLFLAYPMLKNVDNLKSDVDNVNKHACPCCLYGMDGFWHGLYIELKHAAPRKGVLTGEQVVWIDKLKGVGYKVEVAYGAGEAWEKMMDYLHIDDKKI